MAGRAVAPAIVIVSIGILVGGGDQRANLLPIALPVPVLLMLGCLFGVCWVVPRW